MAASPEYNQGIPHERYPEAYAIFGADRMAQVHGNEASAEITQEFVAVVSALVTDNGAGNAILEHGFWRKEGGASLSAETNTYHRQTYRAEHLHITKDNRAVAALTNYKSGKEKIGRVPPRSRAYGEDLYVDSAGVAWVERTVYPVTFFVEPIAEVSMKLATGQEVEEALGKLAEAVFYDDAFPLGENDPKLNSKNLAVFERFFAKTV